MGETLGGDTLGERHYGRHTRGETLWETHYGRDSR